MGFLGIYRAIYSYSPQAEFELQIEEDDLLYVLDKSDKDDWWKAKKKSGPEDDEEPIGLVPHNYVEEVSRRRDYALSPSESLADGVARPNRSHRLGPSMSIPGKQRRSSRSPKMQSSPYLTPLTRTGSWLGSRATSVLCPQIISRFNVRIPLLNLEILGLQHSQPDQ